MLQTESSRCGQNLGNADEIVGGCGKDEKPLDQIAPAVTGLAQTADGLHPTEAFFDLLALVHADGIAAVTGGAPVDRRTAAGIVLCDVRHAATLAATGNEIGRIIALVSADRTAGAGAILDHVEGCLLYTS